MNGGPVTFKTKAAAKRFICNLLIHGRTGYDWYAPVSKKGVR